MDRLITEVRTFVFIYFYFTSWLLLRIDLRLIYYVITEKTENVITF